MMSPVRRGDKPAAELRLVDAIESEAEGGLVDEDDPVMMAAQLDRLEEELLLLAQRLQQFRTGLATVRPEGEESVLVGV